MQRKHETVIDFFGPLLNRHDTHQIVNLIPYFGKCLPLRQLFQQ